MRGGVELRHVQLEIKGHATAAPAEELVRVSVDPERRLDPPTEGDVATPRCGAPLWLQALLGLLFLLALAFCWQTWLKPAPPVRSSSGECSCTVRRTPRTCSSPPMIASSCSGTPRIRHL